MQSSLIVGLVDGNGNLISSQPYNEFQYGRRSKEIISNNDFEKVQEEKKRRRFVK